MLWPFFAALATFVVFDGVWLGLIMSSFYRTALGPLARTAPDGSLAPLWLVAAPVYLLLAAGEVAFVLPRIAGVPLVTAFGWGALFGVVMYGVYDLTNWSTLRGYSPALAMIDIAWGAFVCGSAAVAMRLAARG